MSTQSIKTPCIGLCSTVFGDLVCRGCKRFHFEIIQWNNYSDDEKADIWLRLETLLTQVMLDKVVIVDPDLLRNQLEARQIRYLASRSVYYWAYQLIAKGAAKIVKVDSYGIDLLPGVKDLPLGELLKRIDKEFFMLSEEQYHQRMTLSFLAGDEFVDAEGSAIDQ